MRTFQAITVDAGVSIDGDCAITHVASDEAIEVSIGPSTGGLNLCLSVDAASRLVDVMTMAVADLRQCRATPDRVELAREDR